MSVFLNCLYLYVYKTISGLKVTESDKWRATVSTAAQTDTRVVRSKRCLNIAHTHEGHARFIAATAAATKRQLQIGFLA